MILLQPGPKDNVILLQPGPKDNYRAPGHGVMEIIPPERPIMQTEGGIMGYEGGIISVDPSSGVL